MYYTTTDKLGSFDVITNATGTVLQRNSFDAWGRRRNPTNWTYTGLPTTFLFDRGYTGQACPELCRREHLDKFALINMNGRVYDPIVGRFLSADPFVQSPGNSQSYNRYSYCMNNPLAGTDPSGYFCSWGPINADRARIERENWLFQYEDAGDFYAYHGGGFMNTAGGGAGGGGLGSGQFGGRIGFFFVDGGAVGVGSSGNGKGTQILAGESYLTSSGSEYLGSLGLSQNAGEIGYWISFSTKEIDNSQYNVEGHSTGYVYGYGEKFFSISGDGFKNVWDAGGKKDESNGPWISGPHYSSLDNLGAFVNSMSIEGHTYNDPYNPKLHAFTVSVALLITPVSHTYNALTLVNGENPFTNKPVEGFERWGMPILNIALGNYTTEWGIIWNIASSPTIPGP